MKTTVDVSALLLRVVRKIVHRDGTLLRLVQQGLRQVIRERNSVSTFRLRKASFGGRGLRPELRDLSWEEVVKVSYQVKRP